MGQLLKSAVLVIIKHTSKQSNNKTSEKKERERERNVLNSKSYIIQKKHC